MPVQSLSALHENNPEVVTIEMKKSDQTISNPVPEIVSLDVIQEEEERLSREDTSVEMDSEYYHDEQSAGGTTPHPESDDNTLDMVQEFGLYVDHDEENPPALDIAGEVEKAERSRRGL